MTIVAEQFSYVIGVDTRARTHTLVAVDHLGVNHTQSTFPTTRPGLARAAAWISRNAPGPCLVAMEGTGSYGATFAELAARHVLALPVERVIMPRKHDGDQAALRVLLTARNARRQEKTATSNALTALLRGFDYGIDARKPLTRAQIVPASSGNTTNHRLDRSGDRQLNRARWVIATNRMMFDAATKSSVRKRTAEGQSRRAIIRSLKRYIARSLFRKLTHLS